MHLKPMFYFKKPKNNKFPFIDGTNGLKKLCWKIPPTSSSKYLRPRNPVGNQKVITE